ncbi:hypothetical protein [Croceivirga radicis]|uniref:hypothetical protein n=1 Tax=Croceivirga radicis TaxID=1929488 RepID=UPI000255B3BD|nr:hypothetical protein [Croceivirga radicis]
MKQVKHIASLFFMALFLFVKVSGCHALFHDTDEVEVQHCELCDITNTVNFTPVVLVENTPSVSSQCLFARRTKAFESPEVVFITNYTDQYRFTRPPPHLA